MPIALAATAWMADPAVPSPAPPRTHICWIDHVGRDGSGVRVFFSSSAPTGSEQKSVRGEVGARFMPANSSHDGCVITVARNGDELGVRAEASFFLPGLMQEPQVRSEWIAAGG